MTIQEPQERLAPEVQQPESGSRKTRRQVPARRTDYRLRGLDLAANALSEVQPRLVRKSHPSRLRRRRRLLTQWFIVLAVLAATVVLLRVSVIQPYSVRSTSMVPTLKPGTNVLVVKPRLLTGTIKTGDLVVFHRPKQMNCVVPGDNSKDLLKRVIGTPGQMIWSSGDRIWINGHLLSEPGWYNPPFGELGASEIAFTTIPAGSYFVMGDNRTDPCDSRSFGPIAGSSLVGKVVATTTRGGHPHVRLF